MRQSIRLGTVSGIPVGIHWGLLIIAWLLTLNLADSVLPSSEPGYTTLGYWGAALAGTALFFGSILAHELGHSLVAQREGIKVRAITLWLLGGVAQIEREADSPGAEFRIAAAGPAVSVGLAVSFLAAGFGIEAIFGASLLTAVLYWLGVINGVLAVFNLLPASPLDGGRILTAYLWHRRGERVSARRTAAGAGRVLGSLLIGLGAFQFFSGIGYGVWTAIMGWFLLTAAKSEVQAAEAADAFRAVTAGEAMSPFGAAVPESTTVAHLLAGLSPLAPPTSFAVTNMAGEVSGVVSAALIRSIPAERRDQVRLGELRIRPSDLEITGPDEALAELVERLQVNGRRNALVLSPEGVRLGHIGPDELERAAADHVRRTVAV